MKNTDLVRIKEKFNQLNSKAYWGDDFDVRFYLISKFSEIKNKIVLDIGGGVGVISSELDESNFCINFDLSYDDLKQCKDVFKNSVHVLNGSITNVALKDNSFDYVICAHILAEAKTFDIENKNVIKNETEEFPTISKLFKEIKRILKPNGVLLLTAPNSEYYDRNKPSYDELELHLQQFFKEFSIKLYNTYPRLNSRNRKLNMANVVPKLRSKISNREKIIQELLIKSSDKKNSYSVSFFVEVKKLK